MASSASSDSWENFFESCDIPAEMRKKYAASFVKQRIMPSLLRDISKEDLRELGISVLGDQLAIIRYVKLCDGSPPEFGGNNSGISTVAAAPRRKVLLKAQPQPRSRSATYSDEEPMEMETDAPRSKAPDRDDIYHVKLPAGNLPRTRKIMEMHNALRDQGLIKRGVSGVRRSGIELRAVSNQSMTIQKKTGKSAALVVQDTDVTSSSAGFVPLGTLRSDMISTKTTVVKDESPGKRRIITNRHPSTLPVQVKLNIPQQRKLVTYGNDFTLAEEVLVEQPRLPIAERIQIVGGPRARPIISGGPYSTGGPVRRKRPVVTMAGQKINLGGPARRGPTKPSIGSRLTIQRGAGGSILDRITLAE